MHIVEKQEGSKLWKLKIIANQGIELVSLSSMCSDVFARSQGFEYIILEFWSEKTVKIKNLNKMIVNLEKKDNFGIKWKYNSKWNFRRIIPFVKIKLTKRETRPEESHGFRKQSL